MVHCQWLNVSAQVLCGCRNAVWRGTSAFFFLPELDPRIPSSSPVRVFAGVCSGCHHKLPQTGWLKQQRFVSPGSGEWKSRTQRPAGFVSPETSFLGLQVGACHSRVFMGPFLCAHTPLMSLFFVWTPVLSSGPHYSDLM